MMNKLVSRVLILATAISAIQGMSQSANASEADIAAAILNSKRSLWERLNGEKYVAVGNGYITKGVSTPGGGTSTLGYKPLTREQLDKKVPGISKLVGRGSIFGSVAAIGVGLAGLGAMTLAPGNADAAPITDNKAKQGGISERAQEQAHPETATTTSAASAL